MRHRSRRQKHLACCKAPPHMSSQKRCMMKPRRLRLAAYVVGWGERVGTTARCWRGVRACSDAAVETRHCIRVLPFGSLKPIPVGVRCVGRVKGTRAFGAPHRADVILDVEFVVRVCGTTAAARALVVVLQLPCNSIANRQHQTNTVRPRAVKQPAMGPQPHDKGFPQLTPCRRSRRGRGVVRSFFPAFVQQSLLMQTQASEHTLRALCKGQGAPQDCQCPTAKHHMLPTAGLLPLGKGQHGAAGRQS